MKYKILENLIPVSMSKIIEYKLNNKLFAYNPSTINDNEYDKSDNNIVAGPQFVRPIFHSDGTAEDELFEAVAMPILWFLEEKTGIRVSEIHRIKINLMLPNNTSENNYAPPHYDINDDGWLSMVYYVNEADGDTFIFDKNMFEGRDNLKVFGRSSPKQGNAVIFNSHQWHASSNPINYENRYIINFVFKPEPGTFESFMNE